MAVPGLGRTLGILVVVLSIAALAVTSFAGEAVSKATEQGVSEGDLQGYADGREQGWEAGTVAGYEVGYREGNDIGYADGWVRGSEEGEDKGYAEGHLEGHGDGAEEGYLLGVATGRQAGERDGRVIGLEDGHDDGYADGFEEGVGTDYLVRNPTYSEVLEMLKRSDADTAEQMIADFEEQGIRTGYAWLSVAEAEVARFRCVAFDTVDNGVIFVAPWFRKVIVLEVGKPVAELLGYASPDFDDTLTRVRVAW